ncbi:MAG: hypothetical protein LRZ85_00025 [Alphaproteobacteria bacterium]|nr:hypothetical protein [Alphaproteobacteria bacterium]MCD8571320.1 hypothetical protein [Alphaproteobacteria bacterium]
MFKDHRLDPISVTARIHQTQFEYPENVSWEYLENMFGAFDPDPTPWQTWKTLGIGETPEMMFEYTAEDDFSSIYGFADRWLAEYDKGVSFKQLFNRFIHGFQTRVNYRVLGGTYALPGGQGKDIAERIPGFALISDFESIHRSIMPIHTARHLLRMMISNEAVFWIHACVNGPKRKRMSVS